MQNKELFSTKFNPRAYGRKTIYIMNFINKLKSGKREFEIQGVNYNLHTDCKTFTFKGTKQNIEHVHTFDEIAYMLDKRQGAFANGMYGSLFEYPLTAIVSFFRKKSKHYSENNSYVDFLDII